LEEQEALFKAVLPDVYIDWDYVRVQTNASGACITGMGNGTTTKKNLLGDGTTWQHIMQFLDFGEPKIPDRILQKQHPPLYCMHSAIMSSGTNGRLNFNDACKMLILNNIEGLTSKMMIEMHTSARLNCNTHAICAGLFFNCVGMCNKLIMTTTCVFNCRHRQHACRRAPRP
jgi:hypothetical protein